MYADIHERRQGLFCCKSKRFPFAIFYDMTGRVFNLMAGIRDADKSPNDSSYELVFGLAYLSFISSPVLGIAYVSCVVGAWSNYLINKRRGQPAN